MSFRERKNAGCAYLAFILHANLFPRFNSLAAIRIDSLWVVSVMRRHHNAKMLGGALSGGQTEEVYRVASNTSTSERVGPSRLVYDCG